MPSILGLAIVLITAALVLYSVGVWAERIRRRLLRWHAVCFAAGLACDVSGTVAMSRIAAADPHGSTGSPLIVVMAVTGTIAIALMAMHLLWAIVVLVRDRPSERAHFHRLSLAVWLVWLVPYLSGAIGANLR